MIARFFIDRPIFATVLSIFIVLAGAIAVLSLPLAQYPPISPPQIQVSINYPGASAQVVADTVAAPIEQQVNGVPGMIYMTSLSGNAGTYTLFVTFEIGTDLDTALVMVQNRVQLAIPLLPTSVQNQGITIRKKTPDILMAISIYSPDNRYDDQYLSNFALLNLYDPMLRVDGVSDISILGTPQYSMRTWLDPQKLAALNMNAGDVAAAVASQNLQASSGRVGQPPAGQAAFELPIDTLGRLTEPEQFGEIIIKTSTAPPATQHIVLPSNSNGGDKPSNSVGMTSPAGLPGLGVKAPAANATASTNSTIVSATTSTGNSNKLSMTSGQSNNQWATGGATSGGGASTSGGGTSAIGSTTAGGATSSTAGAQSVSTPTGMGIPGLSINTNSQSGASTGGGMLALPSLQSTAIVRLRDVADIELGAQNYNQASTFDGRPAAGVAIFSLPGTNALNLADRVRAKMADLMSRAPEGIAYEIAYDTTPFIRESITDVVKTLLIAIGLVAIVVLAFLQNWRATIIPMLAVPVAIVGTFAVMAVAGFSLNNISLFGLVLAIGIVVDDAIVVVENVERWLKQGCSQHEAAYKAMDEVSGPVIAVALVLCAVFVPCAFISGITGRFFQQFAVTIAVSTVLSTFNSLTLSPALAALLLRPETSSSASSREKKAKPHRDVLQWILDFSLGWFFRLFNRTFEAGTAAYGWIVSRLLRLSFIVLLAYGGLIVLAYVLFMRAPTGFVPAQDQGRLIAAVQLPDSSALWRTKDTLAQAEAIARKTPGVAHTLTVAGTSLAQQAYGSNLGTMFVVLDEFEKRKTADLSADAIMARLQKEWHTQIKDGIVQAFGAPPVPGLSVAGGFKVIIEDRAGLGVDYLQQQSDALIGKLSQQPGLTNVSTVFRSNTPQLYLDIDRLKVASVGVSFTDLNQTLGIYLGSVYVNSFNEFGRYWQVNLQSADQFRTFVDNLNLISIRNNQGQMVPLSTLVSLREIGGPIFVQRYNLYTAAPITGNLKPGTSSGELISDMATLSDKTLPRTMGFEWTELIFLQIREGDTTVAVFALAVLAVFLALSALYESWALPLAVILVAPMSLLCSIAGVLFAHLSVDIFVQIGLVVLVGLSCKNAILIVEFAKQLHQEGKPRFEATVDASRLRLRPILMTSFAFILGVFPLVVAKGAGAEMRHSLGTAVFTGMFGVTLFGLLLTPVFYYVIVGWSEHSIFSKPLMRRFGTTFQMLANMLLLGLPTLLTHLTRRPDYKGKPIETSSADRATKGDAP